MTHGSGRFSLGLCEILLRAWIIFKFGDEEKTVY